MPFPGGKKRAGSPPKSQYQKDLAKYGKSYAEGAARMRRNAARGTTVSAAAPSKPKARTPNANVGPVQITQPSYLKGTILYKGKK